VPSRATSGSDKSSLAASERVATLRIVSTRIKVYELFPVGGSFSNDTRDYAGKTVAVAATSSRQAHALAHKRVWATDAESPMGMLCVYERGQPPDHALFNGDRVVGSQVRHGAGKRAIRAWMRQVLDGTSQHD